MKSRAQGPLFWCGYERSTKRGKKRTDASTENEPSESLTHLSSCPIVLGSLPSIVLSDFTFYLLIKIYSRQVSLFFLSHFLASALSHLHPVSKMKHCFGYLSTFLPCVQTLRSFQIQLIGERREHRL